MNRIYLYPKNLKEKASLWLWSLRDFAILSVALLFSALALAKLGILLPLGISLGFAFLTIRLSAYTVLEYLSWCMRFFVTGQQRYDGRGGEDERKKEETQKRKQAKTTWEEEGSPAGISWAGGFH